MRNDLAVRALLEDGLVFIRCVREHTKESSTRGGGIVVDEKMKRIITPEAPGGSSACRPGVGREALGSRMGPFSADSRYWLAPRGNPSRSAGMWSGGTNGGRHSIIVRNMT